MHCRTNGNPIEQFKQIGIAHPDTAFGAGLAERRAIGRAVDINVAAHGIARTEAVVSGLATGQPQDTRQYPVTTGMLRTQFRRIDFAGGTPPHKHGIKRQPLAYLGANDVPSARSSIAATFLAHTVRPGGNGIPAQQFSAVIKQFESLLGNVDGYFHVTPPFPRRRESR